jgi:hypothetical protein
MRRLIATNASAAVIIIRVMVGAVFLSEGIQKFLFPADVGAGRFERIGFPSPELVAPFVGCIEIACGDVSLRARHRVVSPTKHRSGADFDCCSELKHSACR